MIENAAPTFEDFYSVYPKKSMKADAEKLWDGLAEENKKKAVNDVLVRKQLHAPWLKGNEFIPNPARYLRREMWNDDLIQKATHEGRQQQNELAQDNPMLARFWTMLIQIYGMKFVNQFGETMPKAWQYSLKDLTAGEAKRVLQYLSKDKDEFVPDLPKINRIRNIGKDAGLLLSLPKTLPTSKEQALAHIADLWRAIA